MHDVSRPAPDVLSTSRRSRLVCVAVVLMFALVRGGAAQTIDAGECDKCHADPKIQSMRPGVLAAMVRGVEGEPRVLRAEQDIPGLYVPAAHLRDSAHAGLACTDCNLGIERLPHAQRLATLSCSGGRLPAAWRSFPVRRDAVD